MAKNALLDLGPLSETVSIRGKDVIVWGVSAEGLFHLVSTFQEIREIVDSTDPQTIDPKRMIEAAPKAVATLRALATTDRTEHKTRDEWMMAITEATDAAIHLAAPEQMSLATSALRLTFPDGPGPFVAQIKMAVGAMNKVTPLLRKAAQETQEASKVNRGSATPSRGRSSGALHVDVPNKPLGVQVRAN